MDPETGVPDSLGGVALDRTPIEIVHPTFLYELLWNLLVAALVVWADRRFRLGHGRAFAVYVAGYTAGRFWIEQMRTDYATRVFGDLRINVVVSALVFLGAVAYLFLVRKPREELSCRPRTGRRPPWSRTPMTIRWSRSGPAQFRQRLTGTAAPAKGRRRPPIGGYAGRPTPEDAPVDRESAAEVESGEEPGSGPARVVAPVAPAMAAAGLARPLRRNRDDRGRRFGSCPARD